MSFSNEIAELIIQESNKSTPRGTAHDFVLPNFPQSLVRDTAISLIRNGKINAEIIDDYTGNVNIAFDN